MKILGFNVTRGKDKSKKKRKKKARPTYGSDTIIVDAGAIQAQPHPALDHPWVCSTYTGKVQYQGKELTFVDGVLREEK